MPSETPAGRARAALTPLIVVCGTLAALVAAGLTVVSGGQNFAALGLPDPGAFTEDGLAVLSVLTEIGAAVCVGSLLLAAFLVPPKASGVLAADGYAAVRTAAWAALAWCVGALLTVPFTVADAAGTPVYRLSSQSLDLITELDQPRAWLITAGIALLLAIACTQMLTWGWSVIGLLVGVFGLFPLAVTGHSSAGGAHDIATDSLLYHLVAAALWVGGLVALLAHARRGGAHLPLATRRFSALALACWLAMAASGVLNAWVRLPVHDLFRTTYGLLVFAKIAGLLLLGVLGYLQRTRSVRALDAGRGRGELLRLAGVELLVMFVTIGIAAALSRTAPPADDASRPSLVASQIGYDLPGAPTLARLLFDWRFDLVYGVLAIAGGVVYLLGVRRVPGWPRGRTISWLAGCLVVLLATSSGVGRYAPAVFSVHLVSHLSLSVLASAFLVLGAPLTLALRALPAAEPAGLREWLVALTESAVYRWLTQPIVALVLFAGSFYGLYLTGLFGTALNYHWAHLAMNALFLLTGCAFYRARRMATLIAAVPLLALFDFLVLSGNTAIGQEFYHSLGIPWMTNLLADQRLAGEISFVFLIPLVVVALGRFRAPQPSAPEPAQVLSTVD